MSLSRRPNGDSTQHAVRGVAGIERSSRSRWGNPPSRSKATPLGGGRRHGPRGDDDDYCAPTTVQDVIRRRRISMRLIAKQTRGDRRHAGDARPCEPFRNSPALIDIPASIVGADELARLLRHHLARCCCMQARRAAAADRRIARRTPARLCDRAPTRAADTDRAANKAVRRQPSCNAATSEPRPSRVNVQSPNFREWHGMLAASPAVDTEGRFPDMEK